MKKKNDKAEGEDYEEEKRNVEKEEAEKRYIKR